MVLEKHTCRCWLLPWIESCKSNYLVAFLQKLQTHICTSKRVRCSENLTFAAEKWGKGGGGGQFCSDKLSFATTKLSLVFAAAKVIVNLHDLQKRSLVLKLQVCSFTDANNRSVRVCHCNCVSAAGNVHKISNLRWYDAVLTSDVTWCDFDLEYWASWPVPPPTCDRNQ